MSKKEIVTYVYPVQSSTWFDPWLTATKTHSAHWLAERSMAGAFSYNPSTKMCIVKKKTEYTPPVQFSNSGAQVSFMVITIASLLDPERAYRSIVGQSRDYTQHFPKYSTLHHHQKFSAQYTQAASVHNHRGRVSQSFDLSVPGSFRLTTNQRVKI
jgi:hypothetical protein